MRIILDLKQSVEENASVYFEKAKKMKKRIKGAEEALEKSLKELERLKAKQEKEDSEQQRISSVKPIKKEWYDKFRWFISSDGFLVIGGRDATTNEIIIKKYAEKGDLVFHTDIQGSPFFVIKAEGKQIGDAAIKEAADATCSFSRAFKLGLTTTPVFYVNPDQVSKEAPSGEYLVKGAFVIKGKSSYVENKVNIAIGINKEGRIMSGPVEAVKANCEKFVEIAQGKEKASSVGKYIQRKIGGDVDSIVRVLPSGSFEIKK